MDLTSAKQTFLVEVVEVLQDMENILLTIESSPEDKDKVNALFRSAHTLKGSAGMIGLEDIERFTHKMESVLDRLRNGEIHVSHDMVDLLLKCKDHVKELVECSNCDTPLDEARIDEARFVGYELSLGLAKYMPGDKSGETGTAVGPDRGYEDAVGVDNAGSLTGGANTALSTPAAWHISLRFGKNLLRDGMDPISTINYLSKLGEIVNLTTIDEALPQAEEMEPEDCYLGIEIDLDSSCDKQAIEDVFEFIMDDSKILVTSSDSTKTPATPSKIIKPPATPSQSSKPPATPSQSSKPPATPSQGSKLPAAPLLTPVDAYVRMIEGLPEDSWMLGEILIRGGVLTRQEVEEAMKKQESEAGITGEKPLIGEVMVKEGIIKREVLNAALDKQQQARQRAFGPARQQPVSSTIRVDAEKLDLLINLVGELVVANGGIKQWAETSGAARLMKTVSFMTKLVNDVRDMSMKMRMVPIEASFTRFQRMVRELGTELGKEIDLVISGGETELDRTIIEKVADPLTHLVRNAVDHGIETSRERLPLNKPSKATLKLNAFYDAGTIVIEVSDDGRGLNKDRIRQKAIEKGLVKPDALLTERDLYNLLFEPGFSTAGEVTKLSGRGVGMDVVKRNIEALRGEVDIESEEGAGTTVRIHLPLTLSIIDGFMVDIGKSLYVIPLDMVVKCFSLSRNESLKVTAQNYFAFQGKPIPYICLNELFHTTSRGGNCAHLVIVQYAGQKVALAVDNLLGDIQVVIKSLGKMYKDLDGVSGATILGDGAVALVIDVPGIIKMFQTAK